MPDATKGAAYLDAEADKVPDIKSALDYRDRVSELWRRGLPPGDKTGWPGVDSLYTVCPGQLSIVTGWPGAGKSEWLDALMVNLTRQSWKFAICSFENLPVEIHIAKLMEKLAGRPFGAGPTARIAEDELTEYCDDLARNYRFITPKQGSISLRRVVETAEAYLLQDDGLKRGLVVDPYNELEHWRPAGISETEYVSEQLSFVRNWARANNVHVWIVAHPQKVPRENGKLPRPRPDMISGSQHWWNKADCAITIWRDPEQPGSPAVDVIVQKIRFKHIGKPGVFTLNYEKVTGRYFEPLASKLYAVAKDGE